MGGANLTLDNTYGNEASQNRIADTAAIILGGGSFNLLGNPAAATTETIGSLAVNSGWGTVNVVPGGSRTATLTVSGSNIARAVGGTLNFAATGTVLVPNMSAGFVGGWATIGKEDGSGSLNFANVSGGTLGALSTYNTGAVSTWAGTDVKANAITALTASGSLSIHTAYLTGGALVNVNGGTLTVAGGGILANAGSGSYQVNQNIALYDFVSLGNSNSAGSNYLAGSTIRAGVGNPDLVINVAGNYPLTTYSAGSGALQVSAILADAPNPTGSFTAVTASGSNVVTLTAGNTSQLCAGQTVSNLVGSSGTAATIIGIIDSTHFTVAAPATSSGTSTTASFASHTGLTKTGGGVLDLSDGNNVQIRSNVHRTRHLERRHGANQR